MKAMFQHGRLISASADYLDYIGEANDVVNGANRNTIHEMFEEHGQAWLGLINRHGDEERARPWVWAWDRSLVYNFGADFVLPADDEELRRLLACRESTPYTGTTTDLVHVNAIFDRIALVGGKVLVWS